MNYEIKNTTQLLKFFCQYVELTPYVSAPINADLTKMHTRLLLALLKETHKTCSTCSGLCMLLTDPQISNLENWVKRLKDELKTREHILNKKESREARIQRKKLGISRKSKK